MKKIPTLFERKFENHQAVDITDTVTPGFEWVLEGEGVATIKWDGSCCAIIDGEFYKRYDAKNGKPIPEGAIKCQEEADPITGHLPCWVKVDKDNPADKWFVAAYNNTLEYDCVTKLSAGTYEAIGKHFNGNAYNQSDDFLLKHGINVIHPKRSFDGIKDYLAINYIEGIVFWKDGEPMCKIKRSDFGFTWNKQVKK